MEDTSDIRVGDRVLIDGELGAVVDVNEADEYLVALFSEDYGPSWYASERIERAP
jgi:hypothetical protein